MHIQDLLIAWGSGKAINNPPNGYPSQTAFARFIARGNLSVAPLDPDTQLHVDHEVSNTKNTKPDHFKVINCAYVHRMGDGVIAREMRFDGARRSRSWVRLTRKAAEAYLEAKLCG